MAQIPGYYTVSEAAEILGRSIGMVCRYIRLGQIHAKRAGLQYLIEQSEIHKFKPNPRGNPNFCKYSRSTKSKRAMASASK